MSLFASTPNKLKLFSAISLALASLLVSTLLASSAPKQYRLIKKNSELVFQTLMGGSISKGEFVNYDGVFLIDTNNLEQSSVSLSIDTTSFRTNVPFAAELASKKDLLWVKRYPTSQYNITSITSDGNNLSVRGLLTIRGVQKETFAKGIVRHGPTLDDLTVEMVGSFNRLDFGMTGLPNLVSNKVTFSVRLHLLVTD